jgi:hypothetical protein
LEKHEALSLEKRIQIRSRRMPDRHAVDRRLRAVIEILSDYPDRGYEFVVASDATISGASSDP